MGGHGVYLIFPLIVYRYTFATAHMKTVPHKCNILNGQIPRKKTKLLWIY